MNLRKMFLKVAGTFLVTITVAAYVGTTELPNKKLGKIELTEKNTVLLIGEVNSRSVAKVIADIEAIKDSAKIVYLYIDSPGGEIMSGLELITYLKGLNNVETITKFAASMASAIVEHNKGKRYILSNGVLMFHRAAGGVSGQFEDGELESRLALWKKIVRGMEKVNAERMKLTLEEYKKLVVNEYWIYGEESIDKNASDALVSISCSEGLKKATHEITVLSIFGEQSYKISKCPLLKLPIKE